MIGLVHAMVMLWHDRCSYWQHPTCCSAMGKACVRAGVACVRACIARVRSRHVWSRQVRVQAFIMSVATDRRTIYLRGHHARCWHVTCAADASHALSRVRTEGSHSQAHDGMYIYWILSQCCRASSRVGHNTCATVPHVTHTLHIAVVPRLR